MCVCVYACLCVFYHFKGSSNKGHIYHNRENKITFVPCSPLFNSSLSLWLCVYVSVCDCVQWCSPKKNFLQEWWQTNSSMVNYSPGILVNNYLPCWDFCHIGIKPLNSLNWISEMNHWHWEYPISKLEANLKVCAHTMYIQTDFSHLWIYKNKLINCCMCMYVCEFSFNKIILQNYDIIPLLLNVDSFLFNIYVCDYSYLHRSGSCLSVWPCLLSVAGSEGTQ